MSYTMAQANALLDSIQTEAELRALVSQLDVNAQGKITILYSGSVGNVYSGDVIKTMLANGEDIRVLDKTEASKFLDIFNEQNPNQKLIDTLERVFGDRPFTVGSLSNQFLFGSISSDGSRISNGAWDDISSRFVAATESDILTLTPDANPQRVFAQTELITILNDSNSKVTSINGILRKDLVKLKGDLFPTGLATQAEIDAADKIVLDYVNATSAQQVSEMKITVDAVGKVEGVDTKDYFNKIGMPDMGSVLPNGMVGQSPADWIDQHRSEEALSNAALANNYLKKYAQERYKLAETASDTTKMAEAGHYLNILRKIDEIIDSSLVTNDVLLARDKNINASMAGEALSVAAQDLERAQQALLESAVIEQAYQQAQAAYVQAKHAQVERIEDRLERLIDRQQARLQQTQQSRSGLLAMPGTKRVWQSQHAQQQARLHTLQGRLEAVHEIKEGMGLLSPKIEELATRKLRAEHPKLTADWDALQEASRRRQIALRQQAKERTQTQEPRPSRSPSLGFASGNA
ncbi:IncP plasmid survival protein KfrC family protein [Methylobacter sp.]|uniref:IncP plasmid survival protein KfrC family protein n=1 Tax=Methylobacter sp. TaxID=2051955 RepID=UPI003DA346B3